MNWVKCEETLINLRNVIQICSVDKTQICFVVISGAGEHSEIILEFKNSKARDFAFYTIDTGLSSKERCVKVFSGFEKG